MSPRHIVSGYDSREKMESFFRTIDWSTVPVEAPEQWPPALRMAFELVANSHRPRFLAWGETFALLYNPAFAELLGDDHPEAFGRPFSELYAGVVDVDAVIAAVEDHQSLQVDPLDGGAESAVTPIRFDCTPVGGDADTKGFVATGVQLVTAVGSSEDRLRWFEAVMASTEDFIYLVDTRGRFIYANQALLELWRRNLSEVVGKDFGELDYPPELAELHHRQIDEVVEHKRSLRAANPYTAPAGETRYYEYIFTPIFDDHQQVEAVAGITRDITEQRRAEHQLQRLTTESEQRRRLHEAIMSSTPDLAYVYDLDHRVLYANDALLEIWDRSLEEVTGKRLSELGHEAWTVEMLETEMDHIVETAKPVRGEIPITDNGERRVYEYLMVPVHNDDGDVEAIAGTTRDVTERKEAEEALREADRRKDRFLAVLSHELRNPLAPIKMGLEMIDPEQVGSDLERRAYESIERQVDQLIRLVDDLLDVTRITRDKIELECEHLELGRLTRRTVDDHRSLFDARDVEITVETPDEPVIVDGDPNRLAQVIGNLLQNAAKFSEPGGHTKVELTTGAGGDCAQLRVCDDGIGIEPEILSTIFEPFIQADVSLAHPTGGLGLGMSLVKGLVELHGGEVDVFSPGVGEGTEVTIRLPVEAEKTGEQTSSAGEEVSSESVHIVVIEDNPDVADMLRLSLESKGHRVEVADDGPGGLELVRSEVPDVVICDIGLPGMDGYEVAEAIDGDSELPSMLLVALSGYARSEDVERSKSAGFEHHLAKPPAMDEIEAMLARVSPDGGDDNE